MNANWIRVVWSEFTGASEAESTLVEALEEWSEVPGVSVSASAEASDSPISAYTMTIPYTVRGSLLYELVRRCLLEADGVDIDAAFPRTPRRPAEPQAGLFEHQKAGVRWLVAAGGGLLADEMGLGKTRTAGSAALEMCPPGGHVLIIGPKFTRAVWKSELTLLGALESDEDFLPFEGVSIPPGFWERAARAKVWFVQGDLVKHWNNRWTVNPVGAPAVVIVDEAHWYKNPTSERTKALLGCIAVIPRRLLTTGTPVANRPRDLWSLLTILCGTNTWGSNWSFRRRYCGATQGAYGLTDGQPTHTDELQARLRAVYLRRTTDEVGLDLPPLLRQIHMAELDGKRFVHKAAKGEQLASLVRALQRGTFGIDTLAVMQRLMKETSSAKLDTTVSLLRELVDAGEPCVVFCQERLRAEQIARELGRDHAFFIHGEQSQEERDALVKDFQAGKAPGILTATYGALREGVTLHRARHVLLHDLSWVPSDVLQAEKRVHRLGQKRTSFSRWVLLPNSFDTLLAAHLVDKARQINSSIADSRASEAFDVAGLTRFNVASFDAEVERFLQQGGF